MISRGDSLFLSKVAAGMIQFMHCPMKSFSKHVKRCMSACQDQISNGNGEQTVEEIIVVDAQVDHKKDNYVQNTFFFRAIIVN